MGADAEEILSSDKPLIEHYLKGFKIQVDVVFLKQLKKALMTGLEGTDIGKMVQEGLTMGGPAFALSTNVAVELNFDDMEEIKAHPMASTVLVSLDQLIQGVLGKDKNTVLNFKPDFSEAGSEDEVNKHISDSEYCAEKKKALDIFQFVGEMLGEFNPDCKVELRGQIFNIGSIEYNIEGAGYGELVNLFYKAVTLGMQQDIVDRIINDYKESNQ